MFSRRAVLDRSVNHLFHMRARLSDLLAAAQHRARHLLGKRQTEEGACKSVDGSHREERGRIASQCDAKQRQHKAHDHVNRNHEQQVGNQEQYDPFNPLHRFLLAKRFFPPLGPVNSQSL